MDGEFVAKWGGRPCARCGQLIAVGQIIRFTGIGKALAHVGKCPEPVTIAVVFRYPCGCKVGECVHFPGE
jgi:hypothetical protein